jgi:hypothetical protein
MARRLCRRAAQVTSTASVLGAEAGQLGDLVAVAEEVVLRVAEVTVGQTSPW